MVDHSSPPSEPPAPVRRPAEPGLKMKGSPYPTPDASPEAPPLPVTRRTMGPPVAPDDLAARPAGLTPSESQPNGDEETEWPSGTALSNAQTRQGIHRIPMPQPSQIGPYNVLEEIGSGGMAVVYKAVQPSLDRLVAIKVLRPEYLHDPQIATRFEREASALAALQHGNLVHVYDFAFDADRAYIVMEYVEGIDLFDILAEAGRIPADVAALIARGVAEGLEHAHHRGIVHRDIKPSNILVSKKGEVKIMDFGIARDPGKSGLTQVGLAVGTPAYMAPEQIRGDRIDFRTDLFGLGIVLYEMLSGEKPWIEEEGRSITIKVLDEPMRPLHSVAPDVPAVLVNIVHRCLQKRASLRFSSTHQLTAALDGYLQRHSAIDPRARLMVFLKNRHHITEREASNTVSADLLDEATVRRRDAGIPLPPTRLLLRPVLWGHAVALLVIIGVCSLAAWGPLRDEPRAQPEVVLQYEDTALEEPNPPLVAPGSAEVSGYLRVVVHPWARVFVDGNYVDTTPFAQPITLPPGEHRIGLRNPYFESQDRFVELRPGQESLLKVALQPRGSRDESTP